MRLKALAALIVGLWLICPVAAQNQARLIFPRMTPTAGTSTDPDNSETTGFAVVNLDATTATLTFTAYDSSGQRISGPGITNPATRTLEAGKQLAVLDFQIFGSAIVPMKPTAWVQVDSTVAKVTGFFLVFNNSLSLMDGADVGDLTSSSFVLPDLRTNCPAEDGDKCLNQILVSNPGNEEAVVTFDLVRSNGQSAGRSVTNLRSKAVAGFALTDLFPNPTILDSDYLRISSNRNLVGFQMFGKKGLYIAGMNGQDTSAGSKTLYCPQYVTGGQDYRTDLSIINLDSFAGRVTLTLFGDDGAQLGQSRTVDVAANSKIFLNDQKFFLDPGDQLIQGYVTITSSGVNAGSPVPKLTGSVVFGDPARTNFSSALPLVKTLSRSYIISHVASNETYFTGLALLNTSPERITLSIQVYDEQGTLLAAAQEKLLSGQRKSQLLWQYIPAFAEANRSSGYIKVTEVGDSTGKTTFACFALFGTNDLTVLSAIPPQIAP